MKPPANPDPPAPARLGSTAAFAPAPGEGAFRGKDQAFTLLEIMIAITIFFIAIFTILALTSRSIEAARGLRQTTADVGSLAADLSLTNRLEEGVESGDFGELYPDYSWSRSIYEVSTNGLFQVDYWVYVSGSGTADPTLSILLYRPESATAGGRVGGFRR
jgi:type II secretory pathway pseudopilin PulG